MPHRVTIHIASRTIAPLILLSPRVRSTNVIGSSTTVSRACTARRTRSTWKQYPWDSTLASPMLRNALAR